MIRIYFGRDYLVPQEPPVTLEKMANPVYKVQLDYLVKLVLEVCAASLENVDRLAHRALLDHVVLLA